MSRWLKSIPLICSLLILSSCAWEGLNEQDRENLKPRVHITGGAAEGTEADYRVEFYWFGSDPDGFVDHFLYAIDDTCLCRYKDADSTNWIYSSDAGECGRADSLAALGDSIEAELFYTNVDSIWRRIDAFSGSFNFQASEPIGGVDPPRNHDLHVFYIKAVDDRGAFSTPDFRHFDAVTIAPTAYILEPEGAGAEEIATVSTDFTVRWQGRDEDSSEADKRPIGYQLRMVEVDDQTFNLTGIDFLNAVKALLEPSGFNIEPNLLIPDSVYVSHPDSATDEKYFANEWYPKIDSPYEFDELRFKDLERANYAFAVRAIDEAGAVMPLDAFNTAGEGEGSRGNIVKLDVNPALSVHPYLTVRERSLLGGNYFNSDGERWTTEVPINVPLFFEWEGDASWYGGRIGGYNYALDIPDPGCEVCQEPDGIGGWAGWGNWEEIPFPIEFTEEDAGEQHILYIRVRDESFRPDHELLAVIVMDVVSFPLDRTALWIDDFKVSGFDDCDHDAVISPIVNYAISPYLPFGQDEIEVWNSRTQIGECAEGDNARELRLSQMGRYKLLFWNRADRNTTLGRVTKHPDPFATRDTEKYLSIYVQSGGSVIVWGKNTVAGMLGDFFPPNRYIPEYPQFPENNFGPGTFLWDILKLRTVLDRAGRGDGPGSGQMHVRCSGMIGMKASSKALSEGFPSGVVDPTGFSDQIGFWSDSYDGRMNSGGWPGANGMIGTPPLAVAGMDTLYNFVSNSFSWKDDDLSAACGSSYLSPLHGNPCAVRYNDPDPLSAQGRVVWIGAPLFIFNGNHAEDLKRLMRLCTDWVFGEGL